MQCSRKRPFTIQWVFCVHTYTMRGHPCDSETIACLWYRKSGQQALEILSASLLAQSPTQLRLGCSRWAKKQQVLS